MLVWPIDWPPALDLSAYDPYYVARAEEAAGDTLRMLTLYRVGGLPITVMPCSQSCKNPIGAGQYGHSYLPFHPILLDSGAYANCWCGAGCGCESRPSILLDAPVGRIDSVYVADVLLSPSAYRVEDGEHLIRVDGGTWPSCAGDSFRVTYLNAYEVTVRGQYVGGVLAAEYLKLYTKPGSCRLPSAVTTVTRQGVSFELKQEMFPKGLTGIPEVDDYLAMYNPNGLRTKPQVYSPDLPKHRTTTWGM